VCCLSFSCALFGGRFAENFPEDGFVVSDIGFFGPVMNHTKQFYPMFDFEALFTKLSQESGKKSTIPNYRKPFLLPLS
jgi:hypothetical protein